MIYVTCTADESYLKYLKVLLQSFSEHCPEVNFFCRLVNVPAEKIEMVYSWNPRVELLTENVTLNSRPDRLKEDNSWAYAGLSNIRKCSFLVSDLACYCNNKRFDNINILLSRQNVSHVVNMDVDCIAVNKFNVENLLSNHDIAIFNENAPLVSETGICEALNQKMWYPGKWKDDKFVTQYPFNDESFIGIKNNQSTRLFFSRASADMCTDMMNWDADYQILNKLYHEFKSDIMFKDLPVEYIDRWFFSPSSYIWNGAAEGKFLNKNFIDKFNHYSAS